MFITYYSISIKVLKNRIDLPVIITSAYQETQTKLEAFRFGALDYLVKPFDLAELEARIRIQLKNASNFFQSSQK